MKRVSNMHAKCCGRASCLFLSGLDHVFSPKSKRALRRDSELMLELRSIIWESIKNPTLPFHLVESAACDDHVDALRSSLTESLGDIADEPNAAF